MPDWSYRTVLRPILFRLAPTLARDFALESMGTLARLPGGRSLIDLLGHMRPDPRLRCERLGIEFAGPIGLGSGLDVFARAIPAFERFGVGFVEAAVAVDLATPARMDVERDDAREAIVFPATGPGLPATLLVETLRHDGRPRVPLVVRLATANNAAAPTATAACLRSIDALAPWAAVFTLGTLRGALAAGWSLDAWTVHVHTMREKLAAVGNGMPLVVGVPSDRTFDELEPWIEAARASGAVGFAVDGVRSRPAGGCELGAPARAEALAWVRRLRERYGDDAAIVAAGGVHTPRQAVELRDAGADLVAIDTGLIFSGPGLVKRCNEAVLAQRTPSPTAPIRLVDTAWVWSFLMGAALLVGCVMALAIAFTRVVLPYDESLTGLTREALAAINERLLDFMVHDRTSVAGAMFTVGVLYCVAAADMMRRGAHWAYVALCASASSGFFSFFAFLGFGYFDPFHAFVTLVLFQLLLMAARGTLPPASGPRVVDLDDDAAWRRSQWGQLAAVVHGVVLIGAGCTILAIGCTFVLIDTDLDYLCTTIDALRAAHPQLVPLIAHDRAALGGMLLAAGIMLLLTSLWGFRRGERGVWIMQAVGFVPGYAAAIAVHWAVGYDEPLHLLPVALGLAVTTATLVFSRQYLCEARHLLAKRPGGN
jgi:dihydroorotate dehydrogenase